MKIGLVIDDTLDSSDGVQQYVIALGAHYTQLGHQVHYLTGETNRTDLHNVHSLSKNLKVSFNKNKMSTPFPVAASRVKALLNELSLDVLHVQMPYSPFMAGKVLREARRQNIPVVGTFHILPASWAEHSATKALFLLQKKSIRGIARLICVSEPAQMYVEKLINRKFLVIPNPVDLKKFAVKRLSKKEIPVKLVFLGRLVERKGCKEFLQALARVNKMRGLDNVEVIICGDGPLRKELEAYVSRSGISAHVAFRGYVTEKQKVALLQKADVTVFPSLGGESFGIVLIEAMAAGASSVLAGDNQGYRWVMENREQQLVQPKDTEEFARKLTELISNKKVRQDNRAWQNKRVRRFSLEKVGKDLLAVYSSAIAKSQKQQHNGPR